MMILGSPAGIIHDNRNPGKMKIYIDSHQMTNNLIEIQEIRKFFQIHDYV